jgi:hypothetical protein
LQFAAFLTTTDALGNLFVKRSRVRHGAFPFFSGCRSGYIA